LLAAVLPNAERYRLDAPLGYVRQRAAWVRTQMRQLGLGYLRGL
jgi:monofunctional biosynthetic peptidoglycan transglycosylase